MGKWRGREKERGGGGREECCRKRRGFSYVNQKLEVDLDK